MDQRILPVCMFIPSLFLESFILVRTEITELDLEAISAKIRATLRHLSIVSCEMDADSWEPTVVYIKNHLTALNELHLAENLVYSDSFDDVDSSEEQKKRYENELLACLSSHGQSDIQSSLAEVLESCPRNLSQYQILLAKSRMAIGKGRSRQTVQQRGGTRIRQQWGLKREM